MRQIAVINQKGGVGKTTSCANLGAAIAAAGQSVLLIDLDPQAHLTMHLGIEPDSERPSIYNVLTDRTPITEAIAVIRENLHLVPSHIDLAAAEMELISVVGREVVLRDALAAVDQKYDLVMIDCPPSLGVLTINGLAAMTEVFVPMQPHFLALQGLGKLLETIKLIKLRINPQLRVTGVILCMYEAGTRLAGEVTADLASFLEASRGSDAPWADARIFKSIIRRNIKLAECPSHGLAIFDYAPDSNGAKDYASLTAEVLNVSAESVHAAMLARAAAVRLETDGDVATPLEDEAPTDESFAAERMPALMVGDRVALGPDDLPDEVLSSVLEEWTPVSAANSTPQDEKQRDLGMETPSPLVEEPPSEPATAATVEVLFEEETIDEDAPATPEPAKPPMSGPSSPTTIPIAFEDEEAESLEPSFETRRGR